MPKYKYFTEAEYLKGREAANPLTSELKENMHRLLTALDAIRAAYGKGLVISSGYRPPVVNAAAGGAKHSNHMTCLAVDFADADKSFATWCLKNLQILTQHGLYMEDPAYTASWTHLQSIPPRSGKRVFKP